MKRVYRNNIIQRIGGEAGFGFLIATYCENIQDDQSLDRFFGNADLKTLMRSQKEFLLISFLEPSEDTEPRKKRLIFQNEVMGIDESIFPVLEQHFVEALEDCCIRGIDFELCKVYFFELRVLFKGSAGHSKYRENIVSRMGGEPTFDFLVLSYCERLENDERLSCYFKHLGSSANLTVVQKELILLAFLHPKANSDFKALSQRVRFMFSYLFELGMNEEHYKMMESHFFAAIIVCLSEPKVIVIETSLRLFSNLITLFEDNLLLSSAGFEKYDEEDEDIVSDTEFDEADDDSIVSTMSLSPNSLRRRAGKFYVANRTQDPLSSSERWSDFFSSPSPRLTRSKHAKVSHACKSVQDTLIVPIRPIHSNHSRTQRNLSIHSRTMEKIANSNRSRTQNNSIRYRTMEKIAHSNHSKTQNNSIRSRAMDKIIHSFHSRTSDNNTVCSIQSSTHNSIDSRTTGKDDETSSVSKRIKDVLNRSGTPEQLKDKACAQPTRLRSVSPKLSKNGRAIMPLTWRPRSPPFKRKKIG